MPNNDPESLRVAWLTYFATLANLDVNIAILELNKKRYTEAREDEARTIELLSKIVGLLEKENNNG